MKFDLRKLSSVLSLAAVPLLLNPSSVYAQETMQRLQSEEQPAPQRLQTRSSQEASDFEPNVEFHGFVDGAVTTQFYFGDTAPDNEPVRFGLDQAEIDVIAQPTERLKVRVDLNWLPDFSGDANVTVADLLEQAYFTYFRSPDETGLFLTFGRFNAPIGYESLDRPDMQQYSHGLLFDVATPTNVTGLAAGYTDGTITAQLLLMNDWEAFYSPGDLSIGARFDADFDNGSIGVVAIFNDIVNADTDGEFTFDVDGSYTSGIATFAFEIYFGYLLWDETNEGAPVDDEIAVGALLKSHIQVSDIFALTARFEYLNRYTDYVGASVTLPRGSAYHGVEGTLAGIFQISDNLFATLEFRIDKSLDTGDDGGTFAAPVIAKQVALNPTTESVIFTPTFELTAAF